MVGLGLNQQNYGQTISTTTMSNDAWDDDWVAEARKEEKTVIGGGNSVKINSPTVTGNAAGASGTGYRPQVRMLKRDTSQSPSPIPESPKDKNSSQTIEERLLEKQQNYMAAREKIFGKSVQGARQNGEWRSKPNGN